MLVMSEFDDTNLENSKGISTSSIYLFLDGKFNLA